MRHELIIKPSAEKSLDRIARPIRKRILDALETLRGVRAASSWPVKKISGESASATIG
jgi:mRNA-degrading endonuclease RelE of RelBE toxin-antitoxin system